MKILHIGNVAGVSQTLAKYQRKLGHEADVIMREAFSEWGAEFEHSIVVKGGVKRFTLECLARIWKYDIIHCHAFPFCSKYLHPFYKWKKFVYHMHGTWIREKWGLPDRANIVKKADCLAVSTAELLKGSPDGTIYIPNPVDFTHWNRTDPYTPNTALYILTNVRQLPSLKQAEREARKHELMLTILDRRTNAVPFSEFPAYLQQFEYYIDTKVNETFDPSLCETEWDIPYSEVEMSPVLSMTGLQQLAIGGKVINDGTVVTKYPENHRPETVALRWIVKYRGLLK